MVGCFRKTFRRKFVIQHGFEQKDDTVVIPTSRHERSPVRPVSSGPIFRVIEIPTRDENTAHTSSKKEPSPPQIVTADPPKKKEVTASVDISTPVVVKPGNSVSSRTKAQAPTTKTPDVEKPESEMIKQIETAQLINTDSDEKSVKIVSDEKVSKTVTSTHSISSRTKGQAPTPQIQRPDVTKPIYEVPTYEKPPTSPKEELLAGTEEKNNFEKTTLTKPSETIKQIEVNTVQLLNRDSNSKPVNIVSGEEVSKTKNSGMSVTFVDTKREISADSGNISDAEPIYNDPHIEGHHSNDLERVSQSTNASVDSIYDTISKRIRRSGIQPVRYYPHNSEELPVHPKTTEEETQIRQSLEKNDFLRKVITENTVMEKIIAAMYKKSVHAKEIIIKQGDKGAHMYISAKGRFQIIINGKLFNEFSDRRVFGELAILYNASRQATIKALTSGKIWVLDQQHFHQITIGYYIKSQEEIMNFLKKTEKLSAAGDSALQDVANLLKTEFFPAGKQIVKQGDKGYQFFIIRAGTVTITREGEGVVGLYKKGDCFGELALLKKDCRREATVTANAPGVECLSLTRDEFIKHFGEVESIVDVNSYTRKDSVQLPKTEYEEVDIKDLCIVTTLGVGGFGRVELVQHAKDKNLVFALKYLKKHDIVSQNQQEHVLNEKVLQMACKSSFIVRMYRTFRDEKFVFFLMEPCLGGDLIGWMNKQKHRRFIDPDAKFICASVLEAFEYLHARDIIYRDLKPENVVLSANGHFKLADFGLAKRIKGIGKTYSFVGTPEYMAPEIILQRGHDRAVDYWTFGIFIFEMLCGRTPFRNDNTKRVFFNILQGIDSVRIPTYVCLEAQHLIRKLCRPISSERLGMQKLGINDIKNHAWFQDFDLETFAMHSQFKLSLTSKTDTSFVEKYPANTNGSRRIPPIENSGWDSSF